MQEFYPADRRKAYYSIFDIQRYLGSEFYKFLKFFGRAETYKTEDFDLLVPCKDFNKYARKNLQPPVL